jgi:maltose alpha-D-glucosyltransferase/alpha-amylase
LIFQKGNEEEEAKLLPFVNAWIHYASGFFLHAWFESVKDTRLIPGSKHEIEIMLVNYLYEKWLYSLNYELNYRPEWAIVPVRAIKQLMLRPQ